jgi:hypothetical protein
LALDVLEWGIILAMGAGILIWGPERIPEMAKTLAQARKQLDGATKQIQGITKELQTGINGGNLNIDSISNALIGVGADAGASPTTAPDPSAQALAAATASGTTGTQKKSADQLLIEMARNLNVSTQGKTREEISQAIMEALSIKPNTTSTATPQSAEAASPAPSETQTAPPAPENPAKSDSAPSS